MSQRRRKTDVPPSIGATGDAYDDATAESSLPIRKHELRRSLPMRSLELVSVLALSLFASILHAAPLVDTIVVGMPADPKPLDMARSLRTQPVALISATYETLVAMPNDATSTANVYLPRLAQSWKASADRLTWTFQLDRSHRFDDGSEVKADAVVFTFKRLLGLKRGPASMYAFIKDIRAVGDYAVEFQLSLAHALFLPGLTTAAAGIVNPRIRAHELNGDFGSQWLSTHTAGSGPYRLETFRDDSYYVLRPNPYYRGARGSINKVILRIVKDESVRSLQLVKGDLDFAQAFSAESLRELERVPTVKIHSGPAFAFKILAFNTETGVMSNRSAREAASYAIDYASIVDIVLRGRAERMRGPLPADMLAADKGAAFFHSTYDMEKASGIFHRAGLTKHLPLTILYSNSSPTTDAILAMAQNSLNSIGFSVRLQRLSLPSLYERMERGSYDAVLTNWFGGIRDPGVVVNFWFDPEKFGSAGNYARYSNPQVTQLLQDSVSVPDLSGRMRLIREAMLLAGKDYPYLYLAQEHSSMAVSTRVENYRFDPNAPDDFRFHQLGASH